MKPSISLIICTYNNAPLLDRVLLSISKQKTSIDCDWSVLVINNNCTDNTTEVVTNFIHSGNIPNLSIINEEKQGLSSARLCGIKNTTAEWIAFVDDDCLLQDNWVEEAILFAKSHPKCGAFGGKVILDWEVPPSEILLKYKSSFAAQDHGEEDMLIERSCIVGAGLVISRSAILQSGWLDKQLLSGRKGKDLTSGDDSEIIIRIRQAGYEIWYSSGCILNHYMPAKRISEKYLINLQYGFGAMTPQLTLVATNCSSLQLILISFLRIPKRMIQLACIFVTVLIGKSSWIELTLKFSRFRGEVNAFFSLF
jgi:glycosyltransferase involved in cell wall biosynthesis